MGGVMRIAAALGAMALLAPSRVGASEHCSAPTVEADSRALERWPSLPAVVRSAFVERHDIDPCAMVRVTFVDRFRVQVVLPDGRVATRVVSRPEDVVPILEALLVVPASVVEPDEDEPPPPVRSEPAPPPVIVVPRSEGGDAPRASRPTKVQAADPIRGELSALTGARVGSGRASLGLGLLAFVDVSAWLVGLGARLDAYTMTTSPTTVLDVTVLGGRRFRGRTIVFDLALGPAVLVRGFGSAGSRSVAGAVPAPGLPTAAHVEPAMTVPRFVASARFQLRTKSSFRTFVSLDGEVGPKRAADGPEPLPVATIGIALGATVGSQ